jgi:transposase-like protein
MKCPHCRAELRKVEVKVSGARQKATSYQCPKCDYFEFEKKSAQKVISELRESPLKIRQRVVKLSQDRLGIYFNSNVVRSLGIKKGEEIYVSVPDDRHILIELED